ncbi:cytochrome P450 71A1-like isoform X1 [Ananas comosus]|uniref:Cytochrome P450 71A1-like isoform X1 n=1 Tax=Ananas comosus TaxID=4615 RepID=A0A6P5FUG0_ANACO|nr:cytochrome P450 71A1-like isoform X1 [Ananas comosus]
MPPLTQLFQLLLHQNSMHVASFFLSILIISFSVFWWNRKKAAAAASEKNFKQIPSPPRLPLIGNLHQLGALPHRSLRALAAKHGPVMLLHLGRVPAVVISSAPAAQQAMKTNDLAFASRPEARIPNALLYGGDVAFSPYGEYWRQVRRICVLHLLSLKRVQSFRYVRQEEAALLVDKIRAAAAVAASSGAVDVSLLVVNLTNDVICRVAFGRKYSAEGGGAAKIQATLAELTALLGTVEIGEFVPWLGWIDRLRGLDRRVRDNSREWDAMLERVLEDHCSGNEEGDDLVDVLLSINDKDENLGIALTRSNMKALLLDMFAAGTETTFTTIDWVMAELIKHPKVMERAQEEIRRVVGSSPKVEEELLEGMYYLKNVIKETLRLHAPAPLLVPRETIEDTQLEGFNIPAKTRVIINAWAIGRDPKLWERAEEFWPERFTNSPIDFRGQYFEFIPFGSGRRGCPGINFAVSVVELVLANLLYHFDWELPHGMKTELLDMSESSGLTVHRKQNLILVPKLRKF